MSNNRLERVKSSFAQRDNCAQAIISVYGEYLGADHDTCLKIASVFGGGINRTGNMCGAVTGALMVIGLKYGDIETKEYVES
ncbi:MAG: C-GCAxxG-C-C family protein [Candidatus Hodarchaeales archaeon]|jgi:C_GCAxxG_C_C family probable redox protein